jgi:glycosyltransferase involved in cell wall biosynthesis
LVLIGPTLTPADQTYDENLRERVWDLGLQERVIFSGFVPQRYIPVFYRTAFLHINVCEQCALDKTGVEALACGCPVLTSSEAFFDLLHDYPELIIRDEHPTAIAQQVLDCYARRDAYDRLALRDLVVGHHDVHSYIQKLLANLHELVQHRT